MRSRLQWQQQGLCVKKIFNTCMNFFPFRLCAAVFMVSVIMISVPLFSITAQAVVPLVTENPSPETIPPLQQLPQTPLQANAGNDRNVVVGRTVLFDASGSTIPENTAPEYRWSFGDGTSDVGIDATHVYRTSGSYRVRLTISVTLPDGAQKESEATIIVAVQRHLLVLITDDSVSEEKIQELQNLGVTYGTLVIPLRETGNAQEYAMMQRIAQQILKNEENIAASDSVVIWTSSNAGINAFIELARIASLNNTSLENLRLNKKAIINITTQSIISTAKLAQAAYQLVTPQYILVTEPDAIETVIRNPASDVLLNAIADSNVNHQIVTTYTARGLKGLSVLTSMSYALNFMINRGVPVDALFLILILPVMATITAFARQVIGIKALGIFVPTILALAFLTTGMKYGAPTFIAVIAIGTVTRILARKLRILYLPRMAIVLSVLALSVFAMLLVGAILNKTGFISVPIFPILIMAVLTEHFINVQIEQGYRTAVKLTLETFLLAIVGYAVGNWGIFKTTILAYPELVLLAFPINYVLGKYAGLRLMEYLRFRKIFHRLKNEERAK